MKKLVMIAMFILVSSAQAHAGVKLGVFCKNRKTEGFPSKPVMKFDTIAFTSLSFTEGYELSVVNGFDQNNNIDLSGFAVSQLGERSNCIIRPVAE